MVNTHFARMENNEITNIVVTPAFSDDVVEQEVAGKAFLLELTGHPDWLCLGAHQGQGIIGGTYDEELDRFLYPKPFTSYVLDSEYNWVPPIPYPSNNEGIFYSWDEDNLQWKIIEAKDN